MIFNSSKITVLFLPVYVKNYLLLCTDSKMLCYHVSDWLWEQVVWCHTQNHLYWQIYLCWISN